MTKKEIVDVLTGDKEVRDLTSAEETELQNMKVANEASEAEQAEKKQAKAALDRAKKYEFLDGLPDGNALWEVAWVTRELPNANRLISKADKKELKLASLHAKTYKDAYDKITKRHNYEGILKDKKFITTIDKKRQELTGKDIINIINESNKPQVLAQKH